MGSPSYMRSVVDRNVVMRLMTIRTLQLRMDNHSPQLPNSVQNSCLDVHIHLRYPQRLPSWLPAGILFWVGWNSITVFLCLKMAAASVLPHLRLQTQEAYVGNRTQTVPFTDYLV